tara:strand:- start:155 stop:430 length:276 start_codon:yes stop_codon:yes gene_type:complete
MSKPDSLIRIKGEINLIINKIIEEIKKQKINLNKSMVLKKTILRPLTLISFICLFNQSSALCKKCIFIFFVFDLKTWILLIILLIVNNANL